MNRRLQLTLVVAAALVAVAAAAAAELRQTRSVDEGITSIALGGTVSARVVLPASYDDNPRRRYPVVYFLHGLPGSSSSYQGNDWLVQALQKAGQAILVLPQGARDADSDPEYLDWGKGRNWATYVSSELPRYIDAHFRTIADRSGRAIAGLSAGGYGATILGLNHLSTYSVIESWSGYFHPTDPTGTRVLERGPLSIARRLIPALRIDRRRRPTYLAFYVGRGDTRFLAENVQLDHKLTGDGVAHLFELYRGGHETSFWQNHAVNWLRLVLGHLTKPRVA